MTDIKSKILEEVEQIGGNVIAVADAMEKCPTLIVILSRAKAELELSSINQRLGQYEKQ